MRVVRTLILGSAKESIQTSALAAAAEVSAARASQVLKRLQGAALAEKQPNGTWEVDRAALFDVFIETYPGPGEDLREFYALDLQRAARELTGGAQRDGVVSADLAADILSPYRRPTHLIAYLRTPYLSPSQGLIAAESPQDANVWVIHPTDSSVFPRHAMDPSNGIPLADATQVAWDLKRLGGSDRLLHLDRLKTWILSSR